MICVECNTLLYGVQRVAEISVKIEEKLTEIFEFLRVKASQNIILGSYPFSKEEKYERWVNHFIWNRTNSTRFRSYFQTHSESRNKIEILSDFKWNVLNTFFSLNLNSVKSLIQRKTQYSFQGHQRAGAFCSYKSFEWSYRCADYRYGE